MVAGHHEPTTATGRLWCIPCPSLDAKHLKPSLLTDADRLKAPQALHLAIRLPLGAQRTALDAAIRPALELQLNWFIWFAQGIVAGNLQTLESQKHEHPHRVAQKLPSSYGPWKIPVGFSGCVLESDYDNLRTCPMLARILRSGGDDLYKNGLAVSWLVI